MLLNKSHNSGHGFGKTILFGEHFVVYGLGAIVSALSHRAVVTVEKSNKNHELIDTCIKFPGVPKLTWELCHKPILRVLDHLEITTPLRITMHGDLPIPHGGIGSSAAHMVAFARALNSFFGLHLSDEQINQAAYEGEKEIHGNPSGIDNTAATYGGLFWFERKKSQHAIEPLTIPCPIEIVLVETGKQTNTKTVIQEVKNFVIQNQIKSKHIFEEYKKIVAQARQVLCAGDMVRLGSLMNKNHELLQELTVSCAELDNVVSIARAAGALGAKLTGTGRGGMAVALTPGPAVQKQVASALEAAGYTVLQTTIKKVPSRQNLS